MIYHTTYHGLEKWFCRIFEKLGWMILAVHNNQIIKTEAYISSIKHLKEALKQKIISTKDKDKISDLETLLHNTEILYRFVNKHFVFVKQQTPRKSSKKQQLPEKVLQKVQQAIQQQQIQQQQLLDKILS